jgi:molybdopterin synthase catalytic subunit
MDTAALLAASRAATDGAVVSFDGVVRNNTRGRQTLWLDYEAYEPMALRQMDLLATQAMERYGVRQITMVHRLGRLEIGETAVLIVVASAHRAAALDACRWLIDTLKAQVPIWKRETFADGAVWGAGEPFPPAIVPEGGHEA